MTQAPNCDGWGWFPPSKAPLAALSAYRSSAADVISRWFGAGWMRCVFVLGLLISLCAPISAATAHHPRTHHHVIVRPSQSVVVPPGPIPSDENRNLDPSTWGGTCSGCAGKKRGDGGLVGRDAVKVAHQVLQSSVLIGSPSL